MSVPVDNGGGTGEANSSLVIHFKRPGIINRAS